MKITKDMIHSELRFRGTLVRAVLPYFTEKTFRFCNRVQQLMRGFHTAGYRYEQVYVPRGDKTKQRLCVYRPKGAALKNAPCVLWIHGGGYAIGVPEQDIGFIRAFLREGALVVSPDYTLSTTAPYPAALEDCYAALLWLKENSERYGGDKERIAVGGDSAGGGLAAALSIYARDRGEVKIKYQMPLYPMIDDRMTSESARDNDAPLWNTKSNDAAWRIYLSGLCDKSEVPAYAAPARLENFSGLPAAFTYVGDIEPFYDETLDYFNRLKAAGVEAECHVFPGCYHAFDTVKRSAAPSREARRFLLEGFRRHMK